MLSKMNEFDVHSNPSYRDFQVSFEKLSLSILKQAALKRIGGIFLQYGLFFAILNNIKKNQCQGDLL